MNLDEKALEAAVMAHWECTGSGSIDPFSAVKPETKTIIMHHMSAAITAYFSTLEADVLASSGTESIGHSQFTIIHERPQSEKEKL